MGTPVVSRLSIEAETWAADKTTAVPAGHADRAATEMTAQTAAERLPAARTQAAATCPVTPPATSIGSTVVPLAQPVGQAPPARPKRSAVT
ncbi:hypothetical protein OG866_00520 [Streptomyces sp. NBC_00663]|nr:hypothetical protein [Streptomyces sp. NBC_00663]